MALLDFVDRWRGRMVDELSEARETRAGRLGGLGRPSTAGVDAMVLAVVTWLSRRSGSVAV